jgi:hypothetical protein
MITRLSIFLEHFISTIRGNSISTKLGMILSKIASDKCSIGGKRLPGRYNKATRWLELIELAWSWPIRARNDEAQHPAQRIPADNDGLGHISSVTFKRAPFVGWRGFPHPSLVSQRRERHIYTTGCSPCASDDGYAPPLSATQPGPVRPLCWAC